MEEKSKRVAIDNTLNQLAKSLKKYDDNEKNKELLKEVENVIKKTKQKK